MDYGILGVDLDIITPISLDTGFHLDLLIEGLGPGGLVSQEDPETRTVPSPTELLKT